MTKTTSLARMAAALLALTACSNQVDPFAGSGGGDPAASVASGGAVGGVSQPWHEACPKDEREQRLIDVGEVSLNVACRGSGPTVVFLHGFPEFHYSWDKVMDELAGEYRLVAPDQRGYNISDKPPEVADYLLPKLADDILKLLPLVSAEPVILVAHDWGGPVGWLVAHHADAHIRGFMATNGPHPARLADLIANDPEQKQASSYMALFRSDTAEQFLTPDYIVKEFFGFLSPEDEVIYLEALSQPGAITGGLNWYRANDIDVDSVKALMAEVSPTVNVPVSVLWGLDDTAVLPKNADGLEPYAPDLEVETFAGVDHWIEHRIPGKIADAIRALDKRITSK
jgi:pimeloyl-ACP methyl ester carboxylesterase